MPRLPNIVYRRRTRGLGRENVRLPLRWANSEAAASRATYALAEAAARTADAFYDRNNERRVEEALVDYERQRGEMMAEMEGRRFYAPNEVPPELGVQTTKSVTDEFGRVRDVPRDAIPAEEVGIGLYDMRMQGIHQSLLNNLGNDEQRRMFSSRADLATARSRALMQNRLVTFERESLRDARLASMEELVKLERFDEAEALINDTSAAVLSESERQRALSEIRERRVTQPIYRAKAEGDLEALTEHLKALQDPNVEMPGISTQRRATLVTDVRQDINSIVTRQRQEQARWQGENASYMGGQIYLQNPLFGQDRINQAAQSGEINIHQWETLTGRLQSQRGKTEGLRRLFEHGDNVLPPGMRKHADDWYDQLREQFWANGPPEGDDLKLFNQAVSDRVNTWKYIPSGVRDSIYTLVNSQRPEQVASGLTLYRSMELMAPAAVRDMEEGFKDVHRAAALHDIGYTAPQIVDHMNRWRTMKTDEISTLRRAFDTEVGEKALDEFINGKIESGREQGLETSWLGRNAGFNGMFKAFVRERAREHYPFVNSAEGALTAAWGDAMKRFGPTNLDGGGLRLDLMPLEKKYGEGAKEWLQSDIDRQLALAGVPHTHSDVIIKADPVTEQQSGLQVQSYAVLDAEEGGPVYGEDGMPLRYTPDPQAMQAALEKERREGQTKRAEESETLLMIEETLEGIRSEEVLDALR